MRFRMTQDAMPALPVDKDRNAGLTSYPSVWVRLSVPPLFPPPAGGTKYSAKKSLEYHLQDVAPCQNKLGFTTGVRWVPKRSLA